MKIETIRDVPIAKLGERDAEAVCASARALDYIPALRMGAATPGAPSWGWVRNLRHRAGQLVADIETAYPTIAEALRTRRFVRLVADVYVGLKRSGQTFGLALKTITLHGIAAPRLDLVPTGVTEFSNESYEGVRTYEQEGDAGAEIDARAKARIRDSKAKTYEEALDAVLAEEPALKQRYADECMEVHFANRRASNDRR